MNYYRSDLCVTQPLDIRRFDFTLDFCYAEKKIIISNYKLDWWLFSGEWLLPVVIGALLIQGNGFFSFLIPHLFKGAGQWQNEVSAHYQLAWAKLKKKMNDQNKSQVGGWVVNYLFYSALFKNEVLIYSVSLQNLFSCRW